VIDQEAKLLEEMERGRQAQDLLEHPLLMEAFETIRESYVKGWETSSARDVEGREKIWTYLKQLDQLKAHLTTVLQTGSMAREQRSRMERVKDGLRSMVTWQQ